MTKNFIISILIAIITYFILRYVIVILNWGDFFVTHFIFVVFVYYIFLLSHVIHNYMKVNDVRVKTVGECLAILKQEKWLNSFSKITIMLTFLIGIIYPFI